MDPTTHKYWYGGWVERVVDGDTIYMTLDYGFNEFKKKVGVRFVDLDTAELIPRTGTKEEKEAEKKAALQAKAFVEERLKSGDPIVVRSHRDEEGKYGRVLGTIFYQSDTGDWIDLSQEIRDAGLDKLTQQENSE